jgi:hypothetical protein
MPGIIEPESIVLAGCLPDGVGETFQAGKKVILQLGFQRSSIRISRVWPERIFSRTLSASCSISGWDAANAASQRVSSAISSRMRAAIVSCSAGLHFRSWSIARSSSVVMGRVPARSWAMEPPTRILASDTTTREPRDIRRSCVPFSGPRDQASHRSPARKPPPRNPRGPLCCSPKAASRRLPRNESVGKSNARPIDATAREIICADGHRGRVGFRSTRYLANQQVAPCERREHDGGPTRT